MRASLSSLVGALLLVLGVIWTLQGVGVLGGSPMTGVTLWAVLGPITALIGLASIVLGGVRMRRGRRK
ncbi:hypothetical protein SAMN04487819_11752 [Actinopolyspora alba]|uniref:Uncharacterized protein n=1 Tax=Actinopolyspora alba TaxID=673379 RepID=A0A1I2BQD2_9ACTN|nr:hypothetical protein SAMN04487819_11752 [Actinopolyspora alba]